jgi:hypothetical protein
MKIKYCFGKKVKKNLIQITGEGQPRYTPCLVTSHGEETENVLVNQG